LICHALVGILLAIQGCNNPRTQLKSLVRKGCFEEAAKLYAENREHFESGHEDQTTEQLRLVAASLNQALEPGLEAAVRRLSDTVWPAPESEWGSIRNTISSALEELDKYNSYELFRREKFRSVSCDRLQALYDEKTSDIREAAEDAFVDFNHFGDVSFFDAYPAALEPKAFMSGHFSLLDKKLELASPEEIERFSQLYPAARILGAEHFRGLSNLYIAASLRRTFGQERPGFGAVAALFETANRKGFAPSDIPGVKLGMIDIRSRRLSESKLVEFPVGLKVNLPFDVITVDSTDLSLGPLVRRFDYIVVFQLLGATNKKDIARREYVSSKFVAGTVSLPNPDYQALMLRVTTLQDQLRQAQFQDNLNAIKAQSSPGAAVAGLGSTLSVIAIQRTLNKTIQALQTTPAYIEEPVYENYTFNQVQLRARKTVRSKWYVLDCARNTYGTQGLALDEQTSFVLLYGVHEKDPDRIRFMSASASEKDLEAWENSQLVVSMPDFRDLREVPVAPVGTPGVTDAVYAEIQAAETVEVGNSQAAKTTSDDERFASVVVLRCKNALGSGFFVTPDLVLTNLHVVEGAKFVEMKTYEGEETFGKVIQSDIRLDLALVKIQTRGKPVAFFDGPRLTPGATVEAIGHPKGLEFSITRGVISAIRTRPSLYAPDADEILVIQTDAAISPGNSGGPLFLGDRVVGVNTQKITGGDVEGLGFAVHYSEVVKFCGEYLK
jgi:hypothetical protein